MEYLTLNMYIGHAMSCKFQGYKSQGHFQFGVKVKLLKDSLQDLELCIG